MRNPIVIILILCGAAIFTGCSSTPSCLNVVPPKVNLTGEKTVIERQIIGDYRELEKGAWTVSSVKRPSTGTNPEGNRTGDPELIRAINIREQNLKIIRDYKNEGAIGETNAGYISYIKNAKCESNRLLKNQLMGIIKKENSARKTIFVRVTSVKGKPDDVKSKAYAGEFANEMKALAMKNDWVQDNNGNWVRK